MSIYNMSSQDFNNLISESQEKINNIAQLIADIKSDISTKLTVINYETEYLNNVAENITTSVSEDFNYVLSNNNYDGLYDNYGTVIHPKFKSCDNLFNLKPINSEDIYYKDEISVAINDITNDYYKNILKHDLLNNKKVYFNEFKETDLIDGNIKISFTLDIEKAYSISKFNMIEISPYLASSFNISAINIYEDIKQDPVCIVNNINKVKNTRIILDKKYNFKKVEFILKPLYKNNDIYPIGFKHIYFYNADFRNDSYIVVPFNSSEYIDYIEDKLDIYCPDGIINSSLSKENIIIYLDKSVDGKLTYIQQPSNNTINSLSRNATSLYFYIPIKDNNFFNNTVYALSFYIHTR